MKTLTPVQVSNNKQATAKQLATLAQLGHGSPSPLTMGDASQLIKQLIDGRKSEADNMIVAAKQIAAGMNLIALAEPRTVLRRNAAREYEGACPKCGGEDRFHVTSDWFFCRKCHEKRGDAIEFLSWVNGTTFIETCAQLAGGTAPAPTMQMQPTAKAQHEQSESWDGEKERIIAQAAHALLIDGGEPFADECLTFALHKRGITLETLNAFGIGAVMQSLPGTWHKEKRIHVHPKRPAVSFPWYNHDGALVGVKYRFTRKHSYIGADDKERTEESKTSRGQFSGNAFGWQALQGASKHDILFICEGEMNALSIWQAAEGRIDVLSMGSESTMLHLPQLIVEAAKQYKHCIVWADAGSIADEAASQIGAASMYSPVTEAYPKGADANDILCAGQLTSYLAATLKAIGVEWSVNESVNDVLAQVERLLSGGSWEQQRDARWVHRWANGYTEDTPHTRRNAEAAAQRLGVQL